VPLQEKYKKLSSTEQIVLQIISIGYKGVSFKKISQFYLDFLNEKKRNHELSSQELKTILQKLEESSFLETDLRSNYVCNPIISEFIFRETFGNNHFLILSSLIKYDILNRKDIQEEDFLTYGKIQIFRGSEDLFSPFQKNSYLTESKKYFLEQILQDIIRDFDPDFIDSVKIHPDVKQKIYKSLLLSIFNGELPEANKLEYIHSKKIEFKETTSILYECLFLLLRIDEKNIRVLPNPNMDLFQFHISLWEPHFTQICKSVESSTIELSISLKDLMKKKTEGDYLAFLILFYLLGKGNEDNYTKALSYCEYISLQVNHAFSKEFQLWSNFLQYIREPSLLKPIPDGSILQSNSIWSYISFLLVSLWLGDSVSEALKEKCLQQADMYYEKGLDWFSFQVYSILDTMKYNSVPFEKFNQLKDFYISLSTIYKQVAPWQKVLVSLSKIHENKENKKKVRLIWEVHIDPITEVILSVVPKEQILSKTEDWSLGKIVPLKNLLSYPEKYPYLTKKDTEILSHTRQKTSNLQGDISYSIDLTNPEFLIGHPHIYFGNEKKPIEIQKKLPGLYIQRNATDFFRLYLYPIPSKDNQYKLLKESENHYSYYKYSEDTLKIYETLGDFGVEFPLEAERDLLDTLGLLSDSISIQSDFQMRELSSIPEIGHSGKITLRILPFHTGLSVLLCINPFHSKETSYTPYSGPLQIVSESEGQKWNVLRDFSREKENLEFIVNSCHTLSLAERPSDFLYRLETPLQCLEFMLEVESLGDRVELEFPEGNPFSISGNVYFPSVHLNIQEDSTFYNLRGYVEINPNKNIEIHTIFFRLSKSIETFLPMEDGSYLCLTEDLYTVLKELQLISISNKTEILFSPLSIPVVMEILRPFPYVSYDKSWTEKFSAYTALQKSHPPLPIGLKASLRSYQKEGFEWIMRSLEWGAGVCLADDMGLGKTIQTLAVLLAHASQGPSMVVAPTSVMFNWEKEAKEFTPDLQIHIFGGMEREKILESLQPFDLLICSYSILQNSENAEKLSSVQWNIVLLDEAQMVKNSSSKRAESVLSFRSLHKILTTGTPIENHLGELWSLFHFLNPTLFGTITMFKRKFSDPIQKHGDQKASERLQKLVSPFILRRLKKDVLLELPGKTEIILHVELKTQEREFYNSLRSTVLLKLSQEELPESQKRIQVLSELMKLRRACCHPSLVDPSIALEGSKFLLFQEIIGELLENNHRALIFSQFVDHLSLLRTYLQSQGISFQYLDGSSPRASRTKSIDDFQRGEGDVFLISLKAGGSGLNLTGADYVLHMDPWWNPAVEDQASDRAYRMGQKQPVTVYRLITSNTIEESISALHSRKRELAGSILEGVGGKMSLTSKELVDLLEDR